MGIQIVQDFIDQINSINDRIVGYKISKPTTANSSVSQLKIDLAENDAVYVKVVYGGEYVNVGSTIYVKEFLLISDASNITITEIQNNNAGSTDCNIQITSSGLTAFVDTVAGASGDWNGEGMVIVAGKYTNVTLL